MNTKTFEYIVGEAIKAPSGHNSQPWKFHFADDSTIELIPDFSRSLPVGDPGNRELYISVGCAVENLCLAAQQVKLASDVSISPEKVIVHFSPANHTEIRPTTGMIASRQTNRGTYDGTIIPAEYIRLLVTMSGAKIFANGSHEFGIITNFVEKAGENLINDDAYKEELKTWMRYNKDQAEASGDGLSYDVFEAPNMPLWISAPVMNYMINATAQIKMEHKKIMSSSHIALLIAKERTMEGFIELGRTLERFLLKATTLNVATAFINQPCEVPEIANDLRKALLLRDNPDILLRLGHANPAARSRRRPLQSFII
ncbi:MAG: nitroreductase [Muribaculaceae bacterium]|jgi:hypothetical protein|nr:nitroreductase [Muribaculaceae bacterium]